MLVKLSLVVPCYNEEETLVWTCDKLVEKLSSIKNQLITEDSEIIFVDDGSKDSTWKIISKCLKGSLNNLVLFSNDLNNSIFFYFHF